MGLDQYLIAKKYVGGYSFCEEKETYDKIISLMGFTDGEIQKHSPSLNVSVTVGYWRKDNHIHNWFVKNCQDGVDECQISYVSHEKLVELKETCQKVLKDKSKAEELLPTKSGFFFGGTEYDEYYFNSLEETIRLLDSILNNKKFNDWSFYYQASW